MTAPLTNPLSHDEIEELFHVESSMSCENIRWLYGREVAILIEKGMLAESRKRLCLAAAGKKQLLIARDGIVNGQVEWGYQKPTSS
jgi:hypothetical protein